MNKIGLFNRDSKLKMAENGHAVYSCVLSTVLTSSEELTNRKTNQPMQTSNLYQSTTITNHLLFNFKASSFFIVLSK